MTNDPHGVAEEVTAPATGAVAPVVDLPAGAGATLPEQVAREQVVPAARGAAQHEHVAVQQRTAELFTALAGEESPDERARLHERIATLNLPMALHIARRYRGRGEELEDLQQVAAVGLMKAVQSYDPSLGRDFAVFAVPTISGEVKRHFRDKGWSIRPPRRLQELSPRVSAARRELEQESGRAPTISQVAQRLGVDVDEVSECLAATEQYRLHSLDELVAGGDDSRTSVLDTLGDVDAALESTVDRLTLAPLLASLPERDARVLSLRFEQGWTQNRIAEEIGVSQMQVSRLLQGILKRLRTAMEPAA
ncbi:SigB/SigF/SigG family RNA polymerase sigma factor [Paenibacillus sp. TRM 82003]|uniref:SigB/SigF/SigG family RNA polymerase sigma factor n=1 Tax=Kineococcus sp. TRM81007 TaxID=2925831 RepID=UPI001F57E039|nr:SigB/SigF/SigG family RNA polymerase sigma factor [Kineococcus sp. TRM81007]MCI2237413.1 SigB/SigF/SigG family RNA polymerase sigma factor [Kineococcus sp. TRM81007]MCI3919764.1 SigB/SigF/SigG family RNA polymerase sigma factor [Paenibacillus sp. TRM 82003]